VPTGHGENQVGLAGHAFGELPRAEVARLGAVAPEHERAVGVHSRIHDGVHAGADDANGTGVVPKAVVEVGAPQPLGQGRPADVPRAHQ
jgi:hypothetical protein